MFSLQITRWQHISFHSTLHYFSSSSTALSTSLEPFPLSKSPLHPSFSSYPPSYPPSFLYTFQNVLWHVFNAYCHHGGEAKLAKSDSSSLIPDANDSYLSTKCANYDEKLLRHEDFFHVLADFKLMSRMKWVTSLFCCYTACWFILSITMLSSYASFIKMCSLINKWSYFTMNYVRTR